MKLGDRLSFIFSRALILGKYPLVTSSFGFGFPLLFPFFYVFFPNSCRSVSLFGILLKHISLFLVASFGEFSC